MKLISKLSVILFVIAVVNQAAWSRQVKEAKPQEKPKDPERTIITLGDNALKGWQVDAMIAAGAGRDVISAAELWLDIQAKTAEAEKRGVDKKRENAFILDLYRKNFLGNLLNKVLADEAPKMTEEQAKAKYDTEIEKHKVPFNVTYQHITLNKRDQAEKALEEAKKPDVDFAKLVEKYSSQKDPRKGRPGRANYEQLQRTLGEKAAEAVKAAKANDVLGPFMGLKGFEVVKVVTVTQAHTRKFDDVKASIISQSDREAQGKFQKKIIDELKNKLKPEKSQELLDLEKAAVKQKAPEPHK